MHLQGLSQLQELGPREHESHRCRAGASPRVESTPRLKLDNTKVTDAGLVHLQGLSQLQGLELVRHQSHRRRVGASRRVESTPDAVARKHHGHRRRAGASPRVESTPSAVARQHQGHRCRAGASPRVESTPILWLGNTKVTDAGLVHLQGLSQLQYAAARPHESHRPGRQDAPAGIAEVQD